MTGLNSCKYFLPHLMSSIFETMCLLDTLHERLPKNAKNLIGTQFLLFSLLINPFIYGLQLSKVRKGIERFLCGKSWVSHFIKNIKKKPLKTWVLSDFFIHTLVYKRMFELMLLLLSYPDNVIEVGANVKADRGDIVAVTVTLIREKEKVCWLAPTSKY